jgi:hypothetical protein
MSFACGTTVLFGKAVAAKPGVPRFRSAARLLQKHGVAALLPTRVERIHRDQLNQQSVTAQHRTTWRAPAISKRKAAALRKQAIREGTYGSFDGETGVGWDPEWDVRLAVAKTGGQLGRFPYQRVPKKTGRQRTREERARQLEAKMQGMDERMEALHAEKHAKKPPKTFENLFKKLSQNKS